VAEELGRGGFGVVQRGTARDGSGEVAIKLPHFDADLVEPARILREAQLLRVLRHPNVVNFLGLYRTVSGQLALVYELVRGPGLHELVDGEPLEPGRAMQLLEGIAAGLQHLHDAGLVHRDLKSENVLVGPRLTPKLLDFGLLRPEAPGGTLTATGVIAGTPQFSAPEVFDGEPATARSDLFSLGVLAFEMLYGTVPFPGGIIEVMHAHRQDKPPTIPPGSPLPATLAGAFEAVLARDPTARPGSAPELVATLRAGLEGHGLAPPSSIPEPSLELDQPRKEERPFPWQLPALGLAALVALAWGLRPGAPPTTAPPGTPVAPRSPVPGLPEDFPDRYREDLRALEKARLDGLAVAAPTEANAEAPLALREPLVWGRLRRSGPAIRAFDAWLDEGGRPDQLPGDWLAELREVDRRFSERNLPPAPPPLFPHLDLAPAEAPVPVTTLVAAWPQLSGKLASLGLPAEARGWLGTAYHATAEAFLQDQRARKDWQGLVHGGVSRMGLPLPQELRAAVSLGVAQYSKYLDGVWESQDQVTRARFARALLPVSRAIHQATVALARATAEAEPRRRGAVARLAYLALHRLGAVGSKSYLATLTPEDQLPAFEGPAYHLLASLPADRTQKELRADQGGRRALDYLTQGLDAVTPDTPPNLAARLRGEFLVEAMKKPGRARPEVQARVLPVLRTGTLADWVGHGGTGLSRLATAMAGGTTDLEPTRSDLVRLVGGLEALERREPGKVDEEVLAELRRRSQQAP
jgi:hypothetical protein